MFRDAEADRHRANSCKAMRLHHTAHSLGKRGAGPVAGRRGQHHKFVPAPAEKHIARAKRCADQLDELAQHRIASLMPIMIVHLLEMVDIEKDE